MEPSDPSDNSWSDLLDLPSHACSDLPPPLKYGAQRFDISARMTTNDSNPVASYLKTRVFTASPQELRLLLLDGAVKFARQGREAMEKKDFEGIYNGISQCRAIVTELLTSVRDDADPVLAERVRSVYTFIFRELMEVGFNRDIARTDRVIELLEYERETWAMVIEKIGRASAPAAPGKAPTAPQTGPAGHVPSRLSVQA